ncbi:MAG TPA: hypothetical protein VN282_09000 [Pyrinomonadaceae bacterium]|nr:hypothetical protein [Pyrinomonadaceae bacterium]
MLNKRTPLKIFVLLTAIFALSAVAQAQATRTWVSGVGDDVNPCSRTAPCKTFAGAISKTAAGGEIDALDPGGFGAVTITKNITLDGGKGSGWASILASGTNGVNINDSATASPNTISVTLRNISINGAGTTLGLNGINFTSGRRLNVENCQIFNFSNAGINVNQTGVTNNTGTSVFVTNTSIYSTNRGIDLLNSGGPFVTAVVNNSTIANQVDGVRLRTNAHATLNNSSVTFGSTSGITLFGAAGTGAGTTANVINTVVSHNGTGLINNSGATNLGGSTFVENGTAISMTLNNAVKTYGTNNITGTISGGSIQLTPAQ